MVLITIVTGLINQLITGGPHIAVDVLIFPSDFPQLGGQSATEKDTQILDDNIWWLTKTPLKNDGVKVSWDDDIPN